MLKKIGLFAILFAYTLTTSAQDKIKHVNSKTETDSSNWSVPLLVIKGEDFRRYPNAGFLDAVEGMFPWIFGPGQLQTDFLYIVNGYVMININGINLNDIEEVSFVRNNIHAELIGLSRLGTFFISTKKASSQKPTFHLNSQLNAVSSPGKALYSNNPNPNYYQVLNADNKNKPAPLFSNHLSFAADKGKWSFYSAAYHSIGNLAPSQNNFILKNSANNDSTNNSFKAKGNVHNYGILANAIYQISPVLQAGVMINYAHNNMNADSNFRVLSSSSDFKTDISLNAPISTFSSGVNLTWKPSSKFENTLFAEYASNKTEYDLENSRETISSSINYEAISIIKSFNRARGWTARNETKYTIIQNAKIAASLCLNVLWQQRTFKAADSTVARSSGGQLSYSSSRYSFANKYGFISPGGNISFSNIVNIGAGAGYYFGPSFSRYKAADKIAPFANVAFNLQKLLHSTTGFQPAELSFNYAKTVAGVLYQGYTPSPLVMVTPVFSGSFIPNPSLQYFLPRNEMFSVRLTSGMFNNRILLSAEWNSFSYDKIFTAYILYPNPTYYSVAAKETSRGFSGTISALIVNKKDFRLYGRYTAAFPKIKSDEAMKYSFDYINDEAVRTGLQHKAEFKNIFVQLNGLLHLGHVYKVATFNSAAVKNNDFVLNYISIGYNCSDKAKGLLKDGTFFLQARNPYVSGSLKELYLYDRYIGLGANLVF